MTVSALQRENVFVMRVIHTHGAPFQQLPYSVFVVDDQECVILIYLSLYALVRVYSEP